jgi:hypothetical protein
VTTYFRLHPDDEDPQELLEPENQVSRPWGGADHGPCDKCGCSGRCTFRYNAREWEDDCPTCKGTGQITDSQRRGVSVFPDPDGLYRYMLRRDTDMGDSLIVELEGKLSDDVDFDADEGALLVFPTRIVEAQPVDQDRIGALGRELGREVDRQA